MIKLTFLVDEVVLRHVGGLIMEAAPTEVNPVKKEVANMVIEEMLSGKDESFRTINPDFTPTFDVKMDTLKNVALGAILHKSCEVFYKNYQPHKTQNP